MAAVMLPGPSPRIYHKHERIVQSLAGVDIISREESGRQFIRPYMPEQHRAFYESLEYAFIGIRGQEGRPCAFCVAGEKGFIRSPSPTELVVDLHHGIDTGAAVGSSVGFLGLEMNTRRRNRANGIIVRAEPKRLHVHVMESFGNCPKYIQARRLVFDASAEAKAAASTSAQCEQASTGPLGPAQAALIHRADTFFIATYHEAEPDDPVGIRSGADVSHRGGPPGFVQLEGRDRLRWPDYIGNNFFQTLGNIHANHQAGLLFIDFDTGATLQISGRIPLPFQFYRYPPGEAKIDAQDHGLPGAQRTISLRISRWAYRERGLPLRVEGKVDFSPYNPQPSDAQSRLLVTCTGVSEAAEGIKTFHFGIPRTETGQPAAVHYTPGQYASFDIQDPSNESRVLNRTWTISSHPSEHTASDAFSITVKRVGLVSAWLHSSFGRGGILQWRGIGGEFTPQAHSGPALLIAGGIGITPMRTMALEFLRQGKQVMLLYSSRSKADAAFLKELQGLAAANPGRFKFVFSVTGKDSSWAGRNARIDRALIEEQALDARTTGAYLCGPEPFMAAVTAALQELGFPGNHIYSESFSF